ncbi:MAG: hypothetical protein ACYDCG_16770 [Candidatus Acidiferrales bacterium]
MKRLLLVVSAFAAAWATACGGGSSNIIAPPPPTGGFTNASLNGAYVFAMTGTVFDPNNFTSSFDSFSRVGVFIADGKGNIAASGGLEDVHKFGADNTFALTGGSYAINADGRGTLSLITAGNTIQYSISLSSPTDGYMVDMIADDSETASGSFTLQSATTLATGTYVFDFAGVAPDGTGNAISIVGDFIPNGAGSFSSGSFEDINEAGSLISKASISGGSYVIDNNNPGTGRGTATIGGIDYVYYVIDGQRVQLMCIDPDAANPGTILGEAVAQQAGTPNDVTSFNSSSFVFVMAGSDVTSGFPFTRGGRLTATGGGLTNILIDSNDGASVRSLPLLSGGTVTLDGDNSGRGTLTFTDTVQNTGTYTFVFYLNSATQGVVQDVSTAGGVAVVADGTLLAQTGAPFSSSGLAANYAFNWSGVDNNGQEEDFVGALATGGTSPNGAADFNEFGATKQFFNNAFNGVITIGGDGTGSTGMHSAFIATINGSPTTTINYFAYIANPSTILLMGTGPSRVTAGVLTAQTQ